MANIKSQKKRALTNLKRQNARAGQKSELKTAVKKVQAAVAEGNKEAAVEAYNKANKSLDKALVSGITDLLKDSFAQAVFCVVLPEKRKKPHSVTLISLLS